MIDLWMPTPIPLPLKLGYSAFMLVLMPVYLRKYGPTNFLYFCDIALLLTLAGIWLGNPLLLSIATTGILLPQIFWLIDFFANAAGWRISGMTDYMSNVYKDGSDLKGDEAKGNDLSRLIGVAALTARGYSSDAGVGSDARTSFLTEASAQVGVKVFGTGLSASASTNQSHARSTRNNLNEDLAFATGDKIRKETREQALTEVLHESAAAGSSIDRTSAAFTRQLDDRQASLINARVAATTALAEHDLHDQVEKPLTDLDPSNSTEKSPVADSPKRTPSVRP